VNADPGGTAIPQQQPTMVCVLGLTGRGASSGLYPLAVAQGEVLQFRFCSSSGGHSLDAAVIVFAHKDAAHVSSRPPATSNQQPAPPQLYHCPFARACSTIVSRLRPGFELWPSPLMVSRMLFL